MKNKCIKCDNEVTDWKSNLCRFHLEEEVIVLKELLQEWKDYFQGLTNIRRPLKIHDALFLDEINGDVIGWTTFNTPKYSKRRGDGVKK